MAIHADWRSHRGDPRSAAGWLVRSAGRPVLIASTVSFLLMAATILTTDPRVWFFCFVSMILAAIVGHRQWKPLSRAVPRLTPMVPGIDQFAVDFSVRKNGMLVGEDQGTVSFVEGWFYFEGLRTNFSIRQTDVTKMNREPSRMYTLHIDSQTKLMVRAIDFKGFSRSLVDWRSWPAEPGGTSCLPPVRPHLSALPEAVGRVLAGLVLSGLAGLGIGLVAGPHMTESLLVVIFAAFFALVGLVQITRGFYGLHALWRGGCGPAPLGPLK